MKFYTQIFQQLCRAGEEIDKNNTISARLALILVDNVIETLIHRQVRYLFSEENVFLRPSHELRHTIEERKKILRNFNDLVNFFKNETGLISNDYCDMILICHKFRNEAYHENFLREEIIIETSRAYFQICCMILPKLSPNSVAYFSDPLISELFKKCEFEGDPLDKKSIEKWAEKTVLYRKCNVDLFSQQMSDYLLERISGLISSLNFIATWGNDDSILFKEETRKTLKEIQFYNVDKPWPIPEKEYNRLFQEFKEKITEPQINKWKKIAESILPETHIRTILWKFSLIDYDLSKIEEDTDQIYFIIESQIENEIDRLRGN